MHQANFIELLFEYITRITPPPPPKKNKNIYWQQNIHKNDRTDIFVTVKIHKCLVLNVQMKDKCTN